MCPNDEKPKANAADQRVSWCWFFPIDDSKRRIEAFAPVHRKSERERLYRDLLKDLQRQSSKRPRVRRRRDPHELCSACTPAADASDAFAFVLAAISMARLIHGERAR